MEWLAMVQSLPGAILRCTCGCVWRTLFVLCTNCVYFCPTCAPHPQTQKQLLEKAEGHYNKVASRLKDIQASHQVRAGRYSCSTQAVA